MKKMKRFFALFLAMAMVLGMSMTTFAADITKPAEGDKDWVTITGITPDQATFRAYQIIKPDFKSELYCGTLVCKSTIWRIYV